MTTTLRILVVEDDEVDRMAIRRALRDASLSVELREVESCRDAVASLGDDGLDCILLDYRLPDGDGLSLLKYLKQSGSDLPVILLTGQGDELLAVEALKSGATDYLPKSYLNPARLQACLASVIKARQARQAEDEVRHQARTRIEALTPRERQIVDELVKGKANKTIAADLGISCRTVESHRARIMRKTQARSLADLVQLALRATDEA